MLNKNRPEYILQNHDVLQNNLKQKRCLWTAETGLKKKWAKQKVNCKMIIYNKFRQLNRRQCRWNHQSCKTDLKRKN